jgi:hypothetical protein
MRVFTKRSVGAYEDFLGDVLGIVVAGQPPPSRVVHQAVHLLEKHRKRVIQVGRKPILQGIVAAGHLPLRIVSIG